MLTGLHGFHVTLGVRAAFLFRSVAGTSSPTITFGSSRSWVSTVTYVVWLQLFIFVYWF